MHVRTLQMAGDLMEGCWIAIDVKGTNAGRIIQAQLLFEEMREVGGAYQLGQLRVLFSSSLRILQITDHPKQLRRPRDEKARTQSEWKRPSPKANCRHVCSGVGRRLDRLPWSLQQLVVAELSCQEKLHLYMRGLAHCDIATLRH